MDVSRLSDRRNYMRILGLFAVALVVGCSPISTGGTGETGQGAPISGLVTVDQINQLNRVDIISPAGWQCSSTFGLSETPGVMTRTVPLSCNNGQTGTLVLTGNQFQQQIVGTFQLSNGINGRVVFGRT